MSLACSAGVLWTGESCLFMFDSCHGTFASKNVCALEENAHTAGYPNRNPTLLFKTQTQENSRNAFSVKICLSCISFTLFKWGKQKSN